MDNLTEKEIDDYVKRSALCVAACKNLSDDWLRGVIEFGGIAADRLDVLESENKKLRRAIRELRKAIQNLKTDFQPGYHDCFDNGLSMCSWCEADDILEKSKEFADE